MASATDNLDPSPVLTASPASGSMFAIGPATVTLTAIDAAGNTATGSFTVRVVDTTAPSITAPANMTAEATSAAVTFSASAIDIVSGAVSVSASSASGSMFALGTTTVTLSATDGAANTATRPFTVTIRDLKPPTITQADIVIEATGPAGAAVSFTPSATDLVSGSIGVTPSIASGSTFALGTTAVTLAATDAASNTATRTFTVKVVDTTPPVITPPATITAEATGPAGAAVSFSASASDLVSGAVSVTATPASGSTFALGTTTVTLTATDSAGNTATKTFSVKVADTTAPIMTSLVASPAILWPANHKMVAVTVAAETGDAVSAVAGRILSVTSNESDDGLGDGDSATDIVITGSNTVNLRAERSGMGNGRIYTITFAASDTAGNTSTKTVTVSVPRSDGK